MSTQTLTTSTPDYRSVTELAGDMVSQEQLNRVALRYGWAGDYCSGKDAVEVACGTGQGLGYLATKARSIVGGDISKEMVASAQAHYGRRLEVLEMDAMKMPFPDRSKDIIVIFEAIYYLPSLEGFIQECRRVLRPGGILLISSANKDNPEFNPSPFAVAYYGVAELSSFLGRAGFSCRFFADTPLNQVSWRQRLLRPVKKFAVKLNLIPKTMEGKKLLKRLVFGSLVPMPKELSPNMVGPNRPVEWPSQEPNRVHKVIYCAAQLPSA